MTKIQTTAFTCDFCTHTRIMKGSGYPYQNDWKYCYKFSFKVSPYKEHTIRDKYFCCIQCYIAYIANILMEAK